MLVKSLIILVIRKGEELKAPRHASAVATRDIFLTYRQVYSRVGIGSTRVKILGRRGTR